VTVLTYSICGGICLRRTGRWVLLCGNHMVVSLPHGIGLIGPLIGPGGRESRLRGRCFGPALDRFFSSRSSIVCFTFFSMSSPKASSRTENTKSSHDGSVSQKLSLMETWGIVCVVIFFLFVCFTFLWARMVKVCAIWKLHACGTQDNRMITTCFSKVERGMKILLRWRWSSVIFFEFA
jgi:hypothetical protein